MDNPYTVSLDDMTWDQLVSLPLESAPDKMRVDIFATTDPQLELRLVPYEPNIEYQPTFRKVFGGPSIYQQKVDFAIKSKQSLDQLTVGNPLTTEQTLAYCRDITKSKEDRLWAAARHNTARLPLQVAIQYMNKWQRNPGVPASTKIQILAQAEELFCNQHVIVSDGHDGWVAYGLGLNNSLASVLLRPDPRLAASEYSEHSVNYLDCQLSFMPVRHQHSQMPDPAEKQDRCSSATGRQNADSMTGLVKIRYNPDSSAGSSSLLSTAEMEGAFASGQASCYQLSRDFNTQSYPAYKRASDKLSKLNARRRQRKPFVSFAHQLQNQEKDQKILDTINKDLASALVFVENADWICLHGLSPSNQRSRIELTTAADGETV